MPGERGDDVTHDAAPRIDPRFDPRFQRGYDGVPTPADLSAPPVAKGAASDSPAVDDTAPLPHRPTADLDGSAVKTTGAATSTEAQTTTGAPAAVAGAPEPPETLEPTRFGATARLWITLGVSVTFIVVGAGVLWSLMSDRDFFMGRVGSSSEQAVMQFTMNLMPGFVQAGVVGVVVVLVEWSVRGRRAGSDGTDHR